MNKGSEGKRSVRLSIFHLGYSRYLFALVISLSMNHSVQACESRTELEAVYCQVRHDYRSLPSLGEFRRNSPVIQRLLLKRAAAQEGIELPDLAVTTEPVGRDLRASRPRLTNQSTVEKASERPFQLLGEAEGERECELAGELIFCGKKQFQLVENQLNRALKKGSLSSENRLKFASNSGQTDSQHWSNSYRAYIERMLSIGLGASTMSYTKFVYSWQQAEQQGLDAETRFSEMFDYLKRDKQNLSIKARYDTQLPANFGWCQSIAHHLIVCDNRERNWVYALRS
ncbi:MAG: hypothetical protein CL693_07265 [Cellvibrionaceae bacterium]|nr:hypothetical protein [Cellvibrionaceae bacterium]|tara:strand:- start:24543 stop:25397 length:855 start_codon:yes stop_codon:yes gene_type:complete